MNRPQLEKARVLAKDAEVDLTVCFNPKELQVEKSAHWDPFCAIRDEPYAVFGPTSPATLSVTLHFDTYESKESVYQKYIWHIEKLVHIMSDKRRRPPYTRFVWGSFCFGGVVESLSQKYTMFIANGIPVRCECTLRMRKFRGAIGRYECAPDPETDETQTFSRLWSGAAK